MPPDLHVLITAGAIGLGLGLLCSRIATHVALRYRAEQYAHPPRRVPAPAAALVAACAATGLTWRFGLLACLLALPLFPLFTAALVDIETRILPDQLTLPGAALAVPVAVLGIGLPLADVLAGAAVGSAAFVALRLAFRHLPDPDPLGLGDAKLVFGIGALTGLGGLAPALLLASICALMASPAFTPRGQSLFKAAVPLGPFLLLGGLGTLILWHPHPLF